MTKADLPNGDAETRGSGGRLSPTDREAAFGGPEGAWILSWGKDPMGIPSGVPQSMILTGVFSLLNP